MNCAPTGAGYRNHQSTWWSTINMQPPLFCRRDLVLLSLFSPSAFCSLFSFSVPSKKARLVSPQRALLQVPDWLSNWHSLKYPSNACRERYDIEGTMRSATNGPIEIPSVDPCCVRLELRRIRRRWRSSLIRESDSRTTDNRKQIVIR